MYLKLKKIVTILFAVLAFFSLHAQESDDWYYDKPIRNIEFEGLENINQNELTGVTSKFIGKNFTDEVFTDLINRVFAIDYFDDVNPIAVPGDKDFKTVKIVIEVVEKPIVKKIRFIGNSKIRPSSIKDVMATKEKSIYDENKAMSDESAIRNFYLSKGYSEIDVYTTIDETDDGMVITYNIDEGRQTVVKAIEFTGNRIATARTLKSKLVTKVNTFLNKGGFQEAMIEQDKNAIAQYYAENGYVDINIINVTQESEYNEKNRRQEVTLTYNIEEGSQYTYSGTSISGNKVFSTEELLGFIKLKKGDVFNATKYQEGISAIQGKYYDNGYWSNQFVPQMDRDSNAKTIGYRVYVEEGARSHIESITVSGNTRTKDKTILRELPLETGDIFSNEKLTTGLRSLYNLQYFSAVMPDVKPGSEENLVDINIDVSEQSTRSVNFGLTFSGTSASNDFPIALTAGISDSNLFGEGKNVSVSGTLAKTSQSISLGYGQNWIFGLPISNNISLSYTHSENWTPRAVFLPDGTYDTDMYFMEYTQHNISLSDTLSRRYTQNWGVMTLSTGISSSLLLNKYDDKIYTPVYTGISDYHDHWNPTNSIFGKIAFDARDFYFDPSKGWFASQTFTWLGLMPRGKFIFPESFGEDEFILRSTTTAEKYWTLFNQPLTDNFNLKGVLAAITTLTMQRPFFNSGVSSNHKLSLDGLFNARGWEIYDKNYARGNLTWNNTLEFRMPIFKNAISFDFFFDASMVKPDYKDIRYANQWKDWYFSYGPGVRLTMPQLPIRLLFVSNFKYEDGHVAWKDRDGDPLDRWIETWHFVLSISNANR